MTSEYAKYLNPDLFGSSIYPGGRLTIKTVRCKQHQFSGSKQPRQPFIVIEGKDPKQGEQTIYLGMGKESEKKYQIVGGGLGYIPKTGEKGVTPACKAGLFLRSARDMGLDPVVAKFALAAFDGMVVDLTRIDMAVGEQIAQARTAAKQDPPVAYIITKVHALGKGKGPVPEPLVKETEGEPAEPEEPAGEPEEPVEPEELAEETGEVEPVEPEPEEGPEEFDLDAWLTPIVAAALKKGGGEAETRALQSAALASAAEGIDDPNVVLEIPKRVESADFLKLVKARLIKKANAKGKVVLFATTKPKPVAK